MNDKWIWQGDLTQEGGEGEDKIMREIDEIQGLKEKFQPLIKKILPLKKREQEVKALLGVLKAWIISLLGLKLSLKG